MAQSAKAKRSGGTQPNAVSPQRRRSQSSSRPPAVAAAEMTATAAAAVTRGVVTRDQARTAMAGDQADQTLAERMTPEDADLVLACLELRKRLRAQPTPAERVAKLEAALEDVKEAVQIEDGSAGYIDAMQRIIAHAIAAIHEAREIEAARPDELQQVRR